jgi:hypothetical protein
MINENSRVWIYQSNKRFNDEELTRLGSILDNFIESWTAHNQQLKAFFELKYNQFIVLIVDETQTIASGCSIDKSVHLMKQIEQEFNVNLFDRFSIAYKEFNEVKTTSKELFEQLVKEGLVNQETIVFNNLISNYKDYLNKWETSFKDSWHNKVFKLQASK